jgi:hypothetical protein
MDTWFESPDEFEVATRRTLLAFSAVALGGIALGGLLDRELTALVLAVAALLVAGAVLPLHALGHRRVQLVGAVAGFTAWVAVLPLFEREAIVAPALMAIGCAVIVRTLLAGTDDHPAHKPPAETPIALGGWIEEDGRQIPG